jgi:folate-binding protein YgfZ
MPIDPRRGSFFDLSNRIKLRLTGNDRARFVNGQITNDIRKATESSAIAACILNPKGKLNAYTFLSLDGDSILIDADAAQSDTLFIRLERYIIADDVQIEDVTSRFSIFHILGDKVAPELGRVVAINRFGLAGLDLWTECARHAEVVDALSGALLFCDENCAGVFRIEQGIPAFNKELTDEIIPVEANLEETAIDYTKGCYIGQEVISRMKMSGQRNKSLCGLISVHDGPLAPGMKLYPMGEEKREAGWLTSATRSDRLGKQIALGYVRRGFNLVGAQLDALDPENPTGSAVIRVEVTDLPFLR